MQWERASYYISIRPEIIVTIFDLGFTKSNTKSNPAAGGTVITVGGID